MKNKALFIGIVVTILIGTLFFFSGFVAGQEEYTIDGYVYDSNDQDTISNAQIVAVNTDNPMVTEEIYTDYNGYYSVSLPPGTYTITTSADGYETEVYNDVEVLWSERKDIYLSPEYNNGGGYNDNGDGDGDGDGNGDETNPEDFMPEGLGGNVVLLSSLCLVFIIVLIISFILIAAASLGIFVRLGKIKKDINNLANNHNNNHNNHNYNDYYSRPPPPPSRPPQDWSEPRPTPKPTPAPAAAPAPASKDAPESSFCGKCGSENDGDNKFCKKCGKSI